MRYQKIKFVTIRKCLNPIPSALQHSSYPWKAPKLQIEVRRQKLRTALLNASGSCRLTTCPQPGITTSWELGIFSSNSFAIINGERTSSSPHNSRVGIVIAGNTWLKSVFLMISSTTWSLCGRTSAAIAFRSGINLAGGSCANNPGSVGSNWLSGTLNIFRAPARQARTSFSPKDPFQPV